jgi:iron complex outermembrane receptor protein
LQVRCGAKVRKSGVALWGLVLCSLVVVFTATGLRLQAQDVASEERHHDLTGLSLEELHNVEVTSVSKRPEKYAEVAAAVSVITQEDIRRSGVTSIAEALRLVPGVQVAQIDSNQWAVGIRGFGSRLSRSMLVLMDGRSVYTPLFAGVYWEVQDTLLEDIDRIEVIRGPGGTLWGANAVNGIINIVTKDSKDTQGGLAATGVGSYERGFGAFRYGGKTRQGRTYRLYGKFFDRAANFHPNADNFDGWEMGQFGFRADTAADRTSHWTLQGDLYDGRTGYRTTITKLDPPSSQVIEDETRLSGGNILGRWQRKSTNSDLGLRFYYDRTNHAEPSFEEQRDTVNLDLQQELELSNRYHFIWGAAYEISTGKVIGVPTVSFVPARRTDNVYSGFIHTETTLFHKRLRLAGGTKVLYNSYSGLEAQPTARASWMFSRRQTVWLSFSRSVRTPSRLEHDLSLTSLLNPKVPSFLRLSGTKSFDSEILRAYEAGYRASVAEKAFVTLDVFYDQHPNLMSFELGAFFKEKQPPPLHFVVPLSFANNLRGHSYGAEFSYDWLMNGRWRIGGAYSFLKLDLRNRGGNDLKSATSTEGSSPNHQASVRSQVDLPGNLELDLALRYVSSLPSQKIASYTTSDARFGWHLTKTLELSVVGRNLLQPHHPEFSGGGSLPAEVKRSAYGKMTWRW